MGEPLGEFAWTPWHTDWEATERGEYVLCCRATDSAGNVQPVDHDEVWNYGGYAVNSIQEVPVIVAEPSAALEDEQPSDAASAPDHADDDDVIRL